jgi:hypothetical protein
VADGREAERDTLHRTHVDLIEIDGESPNGNGARPGERHEDPSRARGADSEPETIEVAVGEVQGPAAPEPEATAPEPEVTGPESRIDVGVEDDDLEDELTAADFGGSADAVVNYEDRLVEALPDLARLAAVAWTRTAAWGFGAGVRVGARLARATVDPTAAAELAQGVSSGMRSYAREFLGISELEDRLDALTPVGDRFASPRSKELTRGEHRAPRVAPGEALRAQGAELLRQSADVSSDDRLHPAFGRILGELAPDEGRILRLLAQDGPQPVVDVRAANLIGVGSQLVAPNLNMVDMQAGTRHSERVPAYLVNLQRLGLASFADEPLDDAITYQVLEAQPHVLAAIQATSRAKTVQRSLRLTPFGSEFCAAVFAPAPAQELPGGDAPTSDDQ